MTKTVEELLTEEIKHLRGLLQRKEQALAILEGNTFQSNGELQTDSPISLNSLFEYPKKGTAKRKIAAIIKQRGVLMRKSEIVETYLIKEGIRETEESKKTATTEVTNAISNLRKEGKIKGYKPADLKIKGGFWGLPEQFNGEEPLEKFIPNLTDLKDDE